MGADKETREKLIDSARREFMEKGYNKASLRKICADAGVTTGALYFFFEDKEALFGAIADGPYNELIAILKSHFEEDEALMEQPYDAEEGDHDAFVEELVHHLYQNYDVFHMLLTKAQGSKYENAVDDLADILDETYTKMSAKMGSHYGGKVNKAMVHWLTHMILDAFIHMITHEKDEKKALAHIKKVMNFITKGWTAVIDK
ncbi:MAG: TetR/AcrR family transcriptional regulator [Lachnospiraceae bacterium]|nr:TetR/AcrR family transcriptional regulator [Lachnospiraceae bacterium]MBQ3037345.1 TetR/AcrR family transcriptional regulator [Lachnospiraceae bacterium]